MKEEILSPHQYLDWPFLPFNRQHFITHWGKTAVPENCLGLRRRFQVASLRPVQLQSLREIKRPGYISKSRFLLENRRRMAEELYKTAITGCKNTRCCPQLADPQFTLGGSVSGGGVSTRHTKGFPTASAAASLCGDFGFGVCQTVLSRRSQSHGNTAESPAVVPPGAARMGCDLGSVWNHSDSAV